MSAKATRASFGESLAALGVEFSQVVALDAVNHALADMRAFNDIFRQRFVGIGKQKVSSGCYNPMLVAEQINELIHRSRRVDLGEVIRIFVVHGERLAIEDNLDISVTTRPGRTKLVRTGQLHLT